MQSKQTYSNGYQKKTMYKMLSFIISEGSSSCPVIRRYNRDDIIVEYSNCDEMKKYICSKGTFVSKY